MYTSIDYSPPKTAKSPSIKKLFTTDTTTQSSQEHLNVNNELRFLVNETLPAVSEQKFAIKKSSIIYNSKQNNTEQLRNDLDEVEALTSRVRDSISIDLSNTRRYSPLLYEYYRKQLELAKSIQCTYNIQCNTLFDAMTLMRKCLKDYCQTVHNPEYLAIDAINLKGQTTNQFSFVDYLAKNGGSSMPYSLPHSVCDLADKTVVQTLQSKRNIKDIILHRDKTAAEVLNNTILTNLSSIQNTSVESASSNLSTSCSDSSFSTPELNQKIDDKQTYV